MGVLGGVESRRSSPKSATVGARARERERRREREREGREREGREREEVGAVRREGRQREEVGATFSLYPQAVVRLFFAVRRFVSLPSANRRQRGGVFFVNGSLVGGHLSLYRPPADGKDSLPSAR